MPDGVVDAVSTALVVAVVLWLHRRQTAAVRRGEIPAPPTVADLVRPGRRPDLRITWAHRGMAAIGLTFAVAGVVRIVEWLGLPAWVAPVLVGLSLATHVLRARVAPS